MDRKPYTSLSEAYMKMFEASEKPGKPPMGMPVPMPYMPLRPVNIHRTNVEIDVTQPYVGPGGVEKAYYSYPAGFDPTNREDIIKDKDYDGSKARPEAAKMTKEEYVDEAGRCWKGYKPVKGKKAYSDGSCTKEDIEVVGDYLMEAGLVSSANDVDAFFTHMSDEWKLHVIESINSLLADKAQQEKDSGVKFGGGSPKPLGKKDQAKVNSYVAKKKAGM